MPERDPDADPRQQFEDADFLDAVREHSPAATREVADVVGCSRRNADYRLKKLREAGRVQSKEVGNSLVWLPVTPEQ